MFTIFELEELCKDEKKSRAFLCKYGLLELRLHALVVSPWGRSGTVIGALPIGVALTDLAIARFMERQAVR